MVKVVFDPRQVKLEDLLRVFLESRGPAQGMRQGNDMGTQYRSGIYYTDNEQLKIIEKSMQHFFSSNSRVMVQARLRLKYCRRPRLLCRRLPSTISRKNPGGYCGLGEPAFATEISECYRHREKALLQWIVICMT